MLKSGELKEKLEKLTEPVSIDEFIDLFTKFLLECYDRNLEIGVNIKEFPNKGIGLEAAWNYPKGRYMGCYVGEIDYTKTIKSQLNAQALVELNEIEHAYNEQAINIETVKKRLCSLILNRNKQTGYFMEWNGSEEITIDASKKGSITRFFNVTQAAFIEENKVLKSTEDPKVWQCYTETTTRINYDWNISVIGITPENSPVGPVAVFVARHDIKKGQELCANFGDGNFNDVLRETEGKTAEIVENIFEEENQDISNVFQNIRVQYSVEGQDLLLCQEK